MFAAGDVARFPAHAARAPDAGRARGPRQQPRLRGRGEHGRAGEPYDHLPFFYSDLFDLGYEAVGEVDARHARRSPSGSSRCARASSPISTSERRPRGFLLWNLFGRVAAATAAIAAAEPLSAGTLAGLIG